MSPFHAAIALNFRTRKQGSSRRAVSHSTMEGRKLVAAAVRRSRYRLRLPWRASTSFAPMPASPAHATRACNQQLRLASGTNTPGNGDSGPAATTGSGGSGGDDNASGGGRGRAWFRRPLVWAGIVGGACATWAAASHHAPPASPLSLKPHGGGHNASPGWDTLWSISVVAKLLRWVLPGRALCIAALTDARIGLASVGVQGLRDWQGRWPGCDRDTPHVGIR